MLYVAFTTDIQCVNSAAENSDCLFQGCTMYGTVCIRFFAYLIIHIFEATGLP